MSASEFDDFFDDNSSKPTIKDTIINNEGKSNDDGNNLFESSSHEIKDDYNENAKHDILENKKQEEKDSFFDSEVSTDEVNTDNNGKKQGSNSNGSSSGDKGKRKEFKQYSPVPPSNEKKESSKPSPRSTIKANITVKSSENSKGLAACDYDLNQYKCVSLSSPPPDNRYVNLPSTPKSILALYRAGIELSDIRYYPFEQFAKQFAGNRLEARIRYDIIESDRQQSCQELLDEYQNVCENGVTFGEVAKFKSLQELVNNNSIFIKNVTVGSMSTVNPDRSSSANVQQSSTITKNRRKQSAKKTQQETNEQMLLGLSADQEEENLTQDDFNNSSFDNSDDEKNDSVEKKRSASACASTGIKTANPLEELKRFKQKQIQDLEQILIRRIKDDIQKEKMHKAEEEKEKQRREHELEMQRQKQLEAEKREELERKRLEKIEEFEKKQRELEKQRAEDEYRIFKMKEAENAEMARRKKMADKAAREAFQRHQEEMRKAEEEKERLAKLRAKEAEKKEQKLKMEKEKRDAEIRRKNMEKAREAAIKIESIKKNKEEMEERMKAMAEQKARELEQRRLAKEEEERLAREREEEQRRKEELIRIQKLEAVREQEKLKAMQMQQKMEEKERHIKELEDQRRRELEENRIKRNVELEVKIQRAKRLVRVKENKTALVLAENSEKMKKVIELQEEQERVRKQYIEMLHILEVQRNAVRQKLSEQEGKPLCAGSGQQKGDFLIDVPSELADEVPPDSILRLDFNAALEKMRQAMEMERKKTAIPSMSISHAQKQPNKLPQTLPNIKNSNNNRFFDDDDEDYDNEDKEVSSNSDKYKATTSANRSHYYDDNDEEHNNENDKESFFDEDDNNEHSNGEITEKNRENEKKSIKPKDDFSDDFFSDEEKDEEKKEDKDDSLFNSPKKTQEKNSFFDDTDENKDEDDFFEDENSDIESNSKKKNKKNEEHSNKSLKLSVGGSQNGEEKNIRSQRHAPISVSQKPKPPIEMLHIGSNSNIKYRGGRTYRTSNSYEVSINQNELSENETKTYTIYNNKQYKVPQQKQTPAAVNVQVNLRHSKVASRLKTNPLRASTTSHRTQKSSTKRSLSTNNTTVEKTNKKRSLDVSENLLDLNRPEIPITMTLTELKAKQNQELHQLLAKEKKREAERVKQLNNPSLSDVQYRELELIFDGERKRSQLIIAQLMTAQQEEYMDYSARKKKRTKL